MKHFQFLFVFLILCCLEQYKNAVFCVQSNYVKPFPLTKTKRGQHSNVKDPEHAVRVGRELKSTDVTESSNDLATENRSMRGTPNSKKHLRVDDAKQVANYFLAGGPSKGHSHFTKATNCDTNNDENNVVGMSNQTTENSTDSSTNEENSDTNSSDSIVGAPYLPGYHRPFLIHPTVQPPSLYKHTTSKLKSTLSPTSHLLATLPHTPQSTGILGSILHPQLHPHIHALRNMPHTLLRAASLPIHGLLHAHSEIRNAIPSQLHALPHAPITTHPRLPYHSHLPILPHLPLLPHLPHLPLLPRLPHLPLLPRLPDLPLIHQLGLPHGPLLGSTNTALHDKNKSNSESDSKNSPTVGDSSSIYKHQVPLSHIPYHNLLTYPHPTAYMVRIVPHTKEVSSSSSPILGSPQQNSNSVDANSNTEENVEKATNEAEGTNEDQQSDTNTRSGNSD